MNYYIPLSILFVALLFIVIRLFNPFKIDSFQAIVFNYLTASICAFILTPQTIELQPILKLLPYCLPIGLLFICIFYILAMVTRTVGVATASVISKMSVIIPVLAGLYLYNENLNTYNAIGVALALIAVYLTNSQGSNKKVTWQGALLMIVYFVGSGLVDTSIKFAQVHWIDAANENIFIALLFGSAAAIGFIKLTYDFLIAKKEVALKNAIGGIVLGTVNYFSIYFVIKALQYPQAQSATTFAIINIGVLLTAAFCGILFFKERYKVKNYAGFALAIVAIILLSN
ncbi:MAG: EamA family transporter [Bacteroidia bacterium]|nr:EamA family transporter [Bacteroidia bacterium]HQU99562.1 GRP family sugar transporter [Bacteroidia bacterium]